VRLWPSKQLSGENPVLARRLRAALFIALLAVLVLATIAASITAYLEASDVQDETLLSVARLVRSNQIDVRDSEPRLHRKDDNDGVQVWALGKSRHGRFPIKASIDDGFHTVGAQGKFWRVYVTGNAQSGARYAVVQNLGVKTEMAINSAVNTALPLMGLFLLTPLLITVIVRHSFKPLNRLGAKIRNSESLQPDLSQRDEIPLEVTPFVSSIDSLLKKNAEYNVRQQRFIADAAHELRTPITGLSLEIENLQRMANSPDRIEREQRLGESASRLQRLVNQLLDLARAQAPDTNHTQVVSLNNLLREQIAELYAVAERKDLEFVVEPNQSVAINDSNHQLQHLLRNALSNAIKFSPAHGTILIELRETDGFAVLCVNDEGPGVSDQHLKKLHEPFYRPADQATNTGAGLGLAICHEIARRLGGQLELSNREGGGFQFLYRQPLAADTEDRKEASAKERGEDFNN
jgi:signal transduction histidine kinase